jgi:uncharacterized coiled-coil protein SlyX
LRALWKYTVHEQQRTIEAQRQEMAALTTRLARVETRISGAPDKARR